MRIRALSMAMAGGLFALPFLSTAAASAAPAVVAPGTFSTAHRVVTRQPTPPPVVTAIRVGHHATFDRVVVQLSGKAPGFSVRYVPTLFADPSGKPVNLLGPDSIQFVLEPTSGHDPSTGHSTLTTPKRTKWRLDEVRETAVIGDFEGVFTLGIGLAHRTPFRVLTLQHPTRIVVDIRH